MTLLCDTNAIVALLVADRTEQREAVLCALERAKAGGEHVVVSESVFVEAMWVLMSRYGLSQIDAASRLAAILSAGGVEMFDREVADAALRMARGNPALSIVDCLLVARSRKPGITVLTFDRRLAREIGGAEEAAM